jgi:hypothetical protein
MSAAREVAPIDGERALRLISIARVLATHTGDEEAGIAIGALARTAVPRQLPDRPGSAGVAAGVRHAELAAGEWWSLAETHATEGLRLARDIGQDQQIAYLLALLALIAAHRGLADECRKLAAEALAAAAVRHSVLVAELTQWALALLEAGLGRALDAERHARDIKPTTVFRAALDPIEAAGQAGRRNVAHGRLAVFEPWAQSGQAAWRRRSCCTPGRCCATTKARPSACSKPRSLATPRQGARSSAPVQSWRSASSRAAPAARPRPGSAPSGARSLRDARRSVVDRAGAGRAACERSERPAGTGSHGGAGRAGADRA